MEHSARDCSVRAPLHHSWHPLLLGALETIACRPENQKYGGKLPPEVVVRLGHVSHATPAQAARMAALGVIAEVLLTSNDRSGAVAREKPEHGQTDRLHPGRKAPHFDEDAATAGDLGDHSLATLIFYQVSSVLDTDAHEVMSTSMPKEFARAQEIIDRVVSGEQSVRIRVDDAIAMNESDGTVPISPDQLARPEGEILVSYDQMSTEKQKLFKAAYEKLYLDANRYHANRPGGR